MTKRLLLPVLLALCSLHVFAGKGNKSKKETVEIDSLAQEITRYMALRDSVTRALHYETGTINLNSADAVLNVPAGFKFLDATQSHYVLSELWGNPKDSSILGMIFREKSDPFTDSSYAFVVSFDPMGYVKDEDAKSVDYGKMMLDMQKESVETNAQRKANGFEPIYVMGWARQPYYDDSQKVLYWARNLKFGNAETNTLNFDVRVLGRKGILSLNAVASMSEFDLVNKDIHKVLSMAHFTTGNTYWDYNSSTDHLAAYTIGGLVAGKVLAKVGFFALIAKFGKLIFAGIAGAFYFVRKKLTGRGKPNDDQTPDTALAEPGATA